MINRPILPNECVVCLLVSPIHNAPYCVVLFCLLNNFVLYISLILILNTLFLTNLHYPLYLDCAAGSCISPYQYES